MNSEESKVGDRRDNLQVDSNLNVMHIAADDTEVAETPNLDLEKVHNDIPAMEGA